MQDLSRLPAQIPQGLFCPICEILYQYVRLNVLKLYQQNVLVNTIVTIKNHKLKSILD